MNKKAPYHKRVRTGAGYLTLEQCRELVAWALETFIDDESQKKIALKSRNICGRQLGLKIHTSNVMNLLRYWIVKNTDTQTIIVAEATAVHHSTVTRNVQRFDHYLKQDKGMQKTLEKISEIGKKFEPNFIYK